MKIGVIVHSLVSLTIINHYYWYIIPLSQADYPSIIPYNTHIPYLLLYIPIIKTICIIIPLLLVYNPIINHH